MTNHIYFVLSKRAITKILKKKKTEGPELLVKSILLLKCKRQQRGERCRREAGGGRVMRGILARGMTSQQVPGALGKCDFIPGNAQTTHHRLEKGRQCRK